MKEDNCIDICLQISDSISVKKDLLECTNTISQIDSLADLSIASLSAGGKIIFAGNGGSFADAQHLSAEFTSRFLIDRPPLSSIALGTNSSAISAIGNDYGYEQVFARELTGIVKPIDIFVPISTSGNSLNIVFAVKKAKTLGIPVIALTGKDGGDLKSLCECICVPSSNTARIQECHIMIGHIVCEIVEKSLYKTRQSN